MWMCRMRKCILLWILLASGVFFLLTFWIKYDAALHYREIANKDWRDCLATACGGRRGMRELESAVSPHRPLPTSNSSNTNQNGSTFNKLNLLKADSSSCKELHNRMSATTPRKRYSDDYYIQTVNELQKCSWVIRPEEHEKFRSELSVCCNAVRNFIVSQNNTPLGTNMSYEVENGRTFLITQRIFKMFPQSQPFAGYPYNQCAVVGNGGILKNSACGTEIDQADFVFRCNLPPTLGNISIDVGSKTSLVTLNPSIITHRFGKLNEKRKPFVETVSHYGEAFLLLPAFSFRSNTALSFKVYHTLEAFRGKQKTIFFHPKYLKSLALFWRSKGIKVYRLSSGFMIANAAIELCKEVRLYGFWPFSKNNEGKNISHHYYDNQLPKPGIHSMPKEFYHFLKLHNKGIIKLQFGRCDIT
ncbi:alpha-2,8-sialyltransferase 8F [Latimeria chalumnae]|uniref:ST8 alpha-N-acetyl-neuraminide alpha-2,8-sialyltransferase 6 n=1 Tax=Latimeria chalumnae TaxID=7897 RepID=H3B3V6_LATCH|nr:PREDICTED: alpha-2,8-sialyltransferase 8F [Latimeria chalumnae]|eukprot:XP_005999075.2 PREDICTED: alpha-2,8-sialyltransferase 8F [Latimeria chalumnae]